MEQKAFDMVDSVEALKAAIDRVRAAQRVFAAYTQEQVDRIFLPEGRGQSASEHREFSHGSVQELRL